jgi:hypothetical protein
MWLALGYAWAIRCVDIDVMLCDLLHNFICLLFVDFLNIFSTPAIFFSKAQFCVLILKLKISIYKMKIEKDNFLNYYSKIISKSVKYLISINLTRHIIDIQLNLLFSRFPIFRHLSHRKSEFHLVHFAQNLLINSHRKFYRRSNWVWNFKCSLVLYDAHYTDFSNGRELLPGSSGFGGIDNMCSAFREKLSLANFSR